MESSTRLVQIVLLTPRFWLYLPPGAGGLDELSQVWVPGALSGSSFRLCSQVVL